MPLAVLPLLLLAAQLAAAQEAAVSARLEGPRVVASVTLRQTPTEAVLASLREGLKSEIVFDLRLYRRQTGFLAWLGDRPVASFRVTRMAAFDPFAARFVTERDGRPERSFAAPGEFLRHFLSLSDHTLGTVDPAEATLYYVVARVRLSPVRLIGLLNIVTLFSSDSTVTDWVEEPVGAP